MAYTHSKYEVNMIPVTPIATGDSAQGPTTDAFVGVQLGITGIVANWGVGFVPHIIRGAAVVVAAANAGSDNLSVGFEGDLTTPGTPTRMFTISVPTGGAIGSHYFRPTFEIEIKPGMEVIARVTAAIADGSRGSIILYVEPRWEEPANVTTMFETTGVS